MKKSEPDKPAAKRSDSREDRLKAALKANLARRKSQTRARSDAKPGLREKKG